MAIKPYFQLVRLPNVFTAAADSLAGWLLVSGSFAAPGRWLPLLGASMAIYAGGIALNDYFDLEVDRAERPNRPLPSGRVSVRFAAVLGFGLLALGIVLATVSGLLGAATWASGAVAVLLVAAVLAYDTVAKSRFVGPVVMGSCRGLNLLLGMSQAPDLGGPTGWWIAGCMALYVAGITCLSRSEVGSGRRAGLILGGVLQFLAIGTLATVLATARTLGGEVLPESALGPGRFALIGVLAAALAFRDLRAIAAATPKETQKAVVFGVLSLVWWNVAIVLALRSWPMALAVALLWLPAYLLSKWIYST